MPRDEEVIGTLYAQHLDPHEDRPHHNCVHAVDADTVDALEPGERGALLIHKAAIGSQFRHGSAGFNPAKDVPFRQVLVFNRDGRLAVDAGTAETLQRGRWEPQALPGQKVSAIRLMVLSCR
jgi:hypothetical protein